MASASSFCNFLSHFQASKPSRPKSLPPSNLFLFHDYDRSKNSGSLVAKISNPFTSPLAFPSSVASSSRPFLNQLICKSGYNVQVIVDPNESEERLLSRFRREVMKAGILQECKRRRYFENSRDKKKRKFREACKRNRKWRPQSKSLQQNKQELDKRKLDEEEEEDIWELPGGELPY